jgi:hypothetical protein
MCFKQQIYKINTTNYYSRSKYLPNLAKRHIQSLSNGGIFGVPGKSGKTAGSPDKD